MDNEGRPELVKCLTRPSAVIIITPPRFNTGWFRGRPVKCSSKLWTQIVSLGNQITKIPTSDYIKSPGTLEQFGLVT